MNKNVDKSRHISMGSVLQGLKASEKGNLKYDGGWYNKDKINQILEECTSPPKVCGLNNDSGDCGHSIQHSYNTLDRDDGLQSDYGSEDRSHTSDAVEKAPSRQTSSEGLKPHITEVELCIKTEDGLWDNVAKDRYEEKKRQFEAHSSMLLKQAENQLLQLYFDQERQTQQLISQAQATEKIRNEEVKKKHLKLKEHHKQHARLLDARLQEAHRKKKEDEEKQKQIEEGKRRSLLQLSAMQQDFNTLKENLARDLHGCKYVKFVTEGAKNSGDLMKQIQDKVSSVVQEAAATEATEKHLHLMQDLQSNARNVYDFVTAQISEANKKGQEEEEAKERKKQLQLKKQEEEKQKQQALARGEPGGAGPSLLLNLDDTAKIYIHYKTLLETVQKSCDPLMEASNKKLKFELQKAVNIPVNAIARTSGYHLRDKLQKLCSLLGGQGVEVGGKKISVHVHPAAYSFVKDLLAKKIVKQGEEQVSSSHESAFPIAAVAVGVWSEFPDVGEMILAHLFHKCPYMVPYYVPKMEGQADEDYYRSLGYNYEGSQIEPQDKFLKRISGLMHLYAALLVSTPPKGPPHPHSLEHGWAWLTRVMNLEPRPDITATLIHDFLSVAGFALMQAYGRQFQKLLKMLLVDFLPKIRASQGAGGPVARLEGYLEKCLKSGRLAQPKGLLPTNFWQT